MIDKNNVIKEYGPLVTSLARKMIEDPELARDAAQEVWLEVVKSLDSFRGEAKISTWIYTIARRVIMKCAKKERKLSFQFLDEYFENQIPDSAAPVGKDGEQDMEEWVKHNCEKCLNGVLHCLDNETRLVYILRQILKLPSRQAAEILQKSDAAVRQIHSRAAKKVQNFMEKKCVLYNPEGRCSCRMKKLVSKTDLPGEFEKLGREIAGLYDLCTNRLDEKVKNVWTDYLVKNSPSGKLK